MEKMQFVHRVSRGSSFNQIYIPKEMAKIFEVGDVVEIRLLRKKEEIYCSKGLKLSDFKMEIIKKIFSSLRKLKSIKQIFVVGSFLTKKEDYHDIDIILISKDKKLEQESADILSEAMDLRFHIMLIPEENFKNLQEICPLTRSMLYYYVSNKKFELSKIVRVDKDHIKYLLMMPEDLLEINASSRVFYDNLRRLVTIRTFLEKKDIDPIKVDSELKSSIGESLFIQIKNGEQIEKEIIKKLREILKKEIHKIRKITQ